MDVSFVTRFLSLNAMYLSTWVWVTPFFCLLRDFSCALGALQPCQEHIPTLLLVREKLPNSKPGFSFFRCFWEPLRAQQLRIRGAVLHGIPQYGSQQQLHLHQVCHHKEQRPAAVQPRQPNRGAGGIPGPGNRGGQAEVLLQPGQWHLQAHHS